LSLDVTLFFPFSEVPEGSQFCGVLHPLDNLEHGNKVDIIPVNHLVNKLAELLNEALILLEPSGVEVETQGSPVGFEMAVEVVAQKSGKLLRSLNVRTR